MQTVIDESKKIKIKIKVNKKDGLKDSQIIMQTLAESRVIIDPKAQHIIYDEHLRPTPPPVLAQSFIALSRVQNPLYQSEYGIKKIDHYNLDLPKQKKIPHSFSRVGVDQILFSSRIQETKEQDMTFALPRQVSKLFESEREFRCLLQEHIKNQKLKIDIELQSIRDDIEQLLIEERGRLFKSFDQVLENFDRNFLFLRRSVQEFKESQKSSYVQLKRHAEMQLQSVSFFDLEQMVKVKEQKVELKAKMETIESEVNKRALIFMVEEIEKQIFEMPNFNETEYTQQQLKQIRQHLKQVFVREIINFDSLTYIPTLHDFRKLAVLPKMELSISDERNQVLGGERNLMEQEQLRQTIDLKLSQASIQSMASSLGLGNAVKGMTLKLQAKFQSHHDSPMTAIVAIDDKTVATGSKSGIIIFWDLQNERLMSSIEAHQGTISALRTFKGYLNEFGHRPNHLKREVEKTFLCTSGGIGDTSIKIWDLQQNILLSSLNGHASAVTNMITLRDELTLASVSDDCTLRFWNVYNSKELKSCQHNIGPINAVTLTKKGKLVTGSSDRTIHIYKIIYFKSPEYNRFIFSDALLENVIEDSAQIYSLNSSSLSDIILSGGSDAKIKLWDTNTKQLIQEIVGHKSPVGDMLVFENPFDLEQQKTISIVSVGTGDDVLRISTSISPINTGVYIPEKVQCDYGAQISPLLQVLIIRQDDAVKVLVVNQTEEGRYFLLLQFE